MKGAHQIFINHYLITSDHISAYLQAYPKTKDRKTAATKGKALLKRNEISNEIVKLQKQKSAIVSQEREEQISEAAKDGILSETEVDLVLSKIIKGELETEKVFLNKNGGAVKIKVKPDHTDIISAADKYYKRFGSYAPEKKKIINPGEESLKEKSDQELKDILKQTQELLDE